MTQVAEENYLRYLDVYERIIGICTESSCRRNQAGNPLYPRQNFLALSMKMMMG